MKKFRVTGIWTIVADSKEQATAFVESCVAENSELESELEDSEAELDDSEEEEDEEDEDDLEDEDSLSTLGR